MYIIDYCIWYNHTCGYDKEPDSEYQSFVNILTNILSTERINEGYCPGSYECKYGKIRESGCKLIKDRFDAREYKKNLKRQIKELGSRCY